MSLEILIDLILNAGILTLAGLCLMTRDTFKSIVLFISLGLLVTIAWTRIMAIDVAIAEAAIGAGLTGALLLAAWRRLDLSKETSPTQSESKTSAGVDHV